MLAHSHTLLYDAMRCHTSAGSAATVGAAISSSEVLSHVAMATLYLHLRCYTVPGLWRNCPVCWSQEAKQELSPSCAGVSPFQA